MEGKLAILVKGAIERKLSEDQRLKDVEVTIAHVNENHNIAVRITAVADSHEAAHMAGAAILEDITEHATYDGIVRVSMMMNAHSRTGKAPDLGENKFRARVDMQLEAEELPVISEEDRG